MTAPGVYKHNKTGNLYMVLGTVIDATNGPRNGTRMVRYCSLDKSEVEYVRDEEEFNSPGRFTYVHGPRKEDV
jgi:hypothetical protein